MASEKVTEFFSPMPMKTELETLRVRKQFQHSSVGRIILASKILPPPNDELRRLYLDERLSMNEISKLYGVGNGTVHKWIHDYDIPVRERINGNFKGAFKTVDGVRLKRCRGPLHPEGAYLTFDYFYPKGNGNPHSFCIRCMGRDGRSVKFSAYYKGWLKSIENRLGVMETARRLGISYKTYWNWKKKSPATIQRAHARAIVHLMRELRHTGEVRHRDSIHHGAEARGRDEKKVKFKRDLYNPYDGDLGAEYKRRYRFDPEIRKSEADARRRRNAEKRERLTS